MMRCAHPGPDAAAPGPYFTEFVEGRRGEILDAALAVFADKGYECGTMREIASRVGVTEPALYRHYAGKEALFEDLVSAAGGRIAERASSRMRGVDPARVRESLEALLEMRRQPHEEGSARRIVGTLLMAAPHKDALRKTFREHILRPMTLQVAAMVVPIDAYYGIVRSPEETANRARAFVSLFVGSFMTSMMFDDASEDTDAATVDAMLAMMGWDRHPA